MDQTLISFLRQRLQTPLPGRTAFLEMAPTKERVFPDSIDTDNAKLAAVLLLLFKKSEEWHTVFIQRVSSNKRDTHNGQISFPGGKREDSDKDLQETALREAREEIGIKSEDVEILGKLSQMYIPVSNFIVEPFIGFLDYPPQYTLQASEVAGIIETPINHFFNPSVRKITDRKVATYLTLKNVPYFDLNGKILWGATAMMMNEFLSLHEKGLEQFSK